MKSVLEHSVRTDTGCLVWTKGLNADGYGVVWLGYGRREDGTRYQRFGRAHCLAWEEVHGPVPDGYVVEHSCHTRDLTCDRGKDCPHRACMDVEHLALVTFDENKELGVEHRQAMRPS